MTKTRRLIPTFLFILMLSIPATAQERSLLEEVKEGLQSNAQLNSVQLQLHVSGQDVTLSGSAASEEQRVIAERTVRGIPGVGSVRNQIRVVPELGAGVLPRSVPDEQLQQDLVSALRMEGFSIGENFTLSVDQGNVSYRGSRKSFAEIDKILAITLNVPGVKDIQNQMTIGNKPYSGITFRHEDGSVTRASDSEG